MSLKYQIECDHACCGKKFDINFQNESETYGDVLKALREVLGWRIDTSGFVVTKTYCPEHSK